MPFPNKFYRPPRRLPSLYNFLGHFFEVFFYFALKRRKSISIYRFFMSLRRACAEKVRKGLFDWITTLAPGKFEEGQKPTSNVFIADFIDLNDNEFCKIVVNLNEKLLKST